MAISIFLEDANILKIVFHFPEVDSVLVLLQEINRRFMSIFVKTVLVGLKIHIYIFFSVLFRSIQSPCAHHLCILKKRLNHF